MTESSPKSWLYVTAVRLGATGGQTTHVVESCRALAARRPATLLAPAAPPEPLPGLQVQLVALPDRPPRELVFQTRVARAMWRIGRTEKPGVLYTRAAALNLGAILAARRLGIPAVLELNGLPALEYALERRGRGARARAMVYGLLARLEARLAGGIVAVTPQLAAHAQEWGARAVFVASNGVNPAAVVPGDRLAARKAFGWSEDAEIVGFVGNLASWQGVETLVRGAAELAEKRPNLRLLLIGDGVERRTLEHLAAPLAERVLFAGRQPHAAVGGMLAACDILAAPLAASPRNRSTGVSPLKVFEYLALGRPVLASALPGLEFIARDRLGATFAPDDPAALARELAALLDLPPAERAAIGACARHAAETQYSWERIMDGIIAFAEGL